MESTPNPNQPACPVEDILIYKIQEGLLLIVPEAGKYEFSYILSDNSKCFNLSLSLTQIDKNELENVKYKITRVNETYYLIIGAPMYPMTPVKDFSAILALKNSKVESLKQTDYARKSVMSGNQSGSGDPVKGGPFNNSLYAYCTGTSHLTFTFSHCTINYISFRLYDGDRRIYHYTVELEVNKKWIILFADRMGCGKQEIGFEPISNVTGVRFSGYNTNNNGFHILEHGFSIKYNL